MRAVATERLPLFTDPPPPDSGSATSRAADRRVSSITAERRRLVLTLLAKHGGLTEDRLEELTGLRGNTVRPLLWGLEHQEPPRVRKTARCELTRSGSPATVYEAIS